MTHVRISLLPVLLALLLGGAAPVQVDAGVEESSAPGERVPVLGIARRSSGGTLGWFDPVTLRPLRGRKAPLGGHVGSWAFSADRSLLAIASCGGEREPVPGIRFVDARTMRVRGDLRLSRFRGCASALTWLHPRRLLAVVGVDVSDERELVVVDPVARRVLRRVSIAGYVAGVGRTDERLVLLLGSLGTFSPARVAVADREGEVRVATAARTVLGTVTDDSSGEYRARTIEPGLAVDPDGERAYLLPRAGPIAEIDLGIMDVAYHEVDRPTLLGRLWDSLFPDAQAKVLEGPVLHARWLGEGMIAVSGIEYSSRRRAGGPELPTQTPVGLTLVDTRSWTSRLLEQGSSGFAVGPGAIVAQGGRWDGEQERGFGPGLRAFGFDGSERWRLHPDRYVWMDTAGAFGYAYVGERAVEVVDLWTGAIVRRIAWSTGPESWPQLLAAQTSDW